MTDYYITGLQHIGIPTVNIDDTVEFYEMLGFKIIYKIYYREKEQWIIFLRLGNLVIETYEVLKISESGDGAINHFSLNCTDIDKCFAEVSSIGNKIISNGIEFMSLWENGVKFFIIEGPNKEKLEFCQRL